MSKWCLKRDIALNDDERFNLGCTDDWGNHHKCEGCPHNKSMGNGAYNAINYDKH